MPLSRLALLQDAGLDEARQLLPVGRHLLGGDDLDARGDVWADRAHRGDHDRLSQVSQDLGFVGVLLGERFGVFAVAE
jgi:hypothetical protein